MENQQMKDLKNYKVLFLGASGSGKTVFLASMFKQLSTIGNKTGFYLIAKDYEQAIKLNNLYLQIADPTAEWPEGTQLSNTMEYRFTCAVQTIREYEVFHFTYFDYAGGWVTDPVGTPPPGFANALKDVDVLLGIFDAQKILAAMGDETKRPRLRHEVTSILQRIQRSEKPVHFAIMKWDLVDRKFTLHDIISELNKIPEFYDFTQWRIKNAPDPLIRIIPVSSVGNGFAVLMPDGGMKKNIGVIPRPERVEMPLACVLMDTFKQKYKIVEEREKEILNKHQKRKRYVTAGETLADLVRISQIPVVGILGFLTKRKVVEAEKRVYKILLESLVRGAEVKRKQDAQKIKQEQEEALKLVKDEQTALEHVLNRFVDLIEELERDFPESRLKPL